MEDNIKTGLLLSSQFYNNYNTNLYKFGQFSAQVSALATVIVLTRAELSDSSTLYRPAADSGNVLIA